MKKILRMAFSAIILLAVVFVFLTSIGRIQLGNFGSQISKYGTQFQKKVKTVVVKERIDLTPEIEASLENARAVALDKASKEIDVWIGEMMNRVDNNFLDDYFSFISVKSREIKSVFYSAKSALFSGPKAGEALAMELEDEVSRKVILPEIAQKRIENITNETVDLYYSTLDKELSKIQAKYKIPTPDWNEYISHIAGLTMAIDQKQTPIALKTAIASGVVLTGLVAAPIIKKIATRTSEKIVAKTASKAVAKATAKTVAKGAGKGAATVAKALPVIGWGVTAAVLVWDIADYVNTSKEGKIQLRQNFKEYFAEIKRELLGSSTDSIMGSVTDLENNMKKRASELELTKNYFSSSYKISEKS